MRHVFLSLLYWIAFAVPVFGQTASLYTVEQHGSRAQCINIVFLSDGYTAADLPSFAGHVNTAVNYLFSREPWQQYRSYCNVYRIEIASNESGTDNGNSAPGGTRDTYFNSGFNTPTVGQLLSLGPNGSSRAFALLNIHIPEYDVPIVLVNDTKYGGAGGSLAVASVHSSSAMVVEHEIGHSFANLADEYDVQYPNYSPTEKTNTTAQTTRSLIRWNYWIDATTPVATPETTAYDSLVGLFEGSMYRTTGWYRPHNNSLMRNLNRPCGSVNREQFVLTYYSRVGPINATSPAPTTRSVTAFETLNFSVTPKAPSSGVALVTTWKVDGVLQSGPASNIFATTSDALGNGTHTVSAVTRDPTTFVRRDPTGLLDDEVTWSFNLSNQLPATLAGWRSEFGADTSNPSGDRISNLVKYSLGLHPNRTATKAELPTMENLTQSGNDYLALTLPRRNRRTDIDYVVEVSSDLGDWRSGTGNTVVVEDSPSLLKVRDALPKASSGRRFIRLRVAPK